MTEWEKLVIITRWQAATFEIAFNRETKIFFHNLLAMLGNIFIVAPLLILRSMYYVMFPLIWFAFYIPVGYIFGNTNEENLIKARELLDAAKLEKSSEKN